MDTDTQDRHEILIVEDSMTQSLKLTHILERHGYRVTATRNGGEALASLRARPPRVVISDINMPEMDGYELCRRIKDDAATRELPVILLTSLSDPNDILKGLECGADNFIVKPYDEEFLLSRIQYVLANQELRKGSQGKEGTEIFFAGQKYHLTSERIHSIDLLLSTYETAVQKNVALIKAKETLEVQAQQLREKNAEMEADLNMARELQTAFLPTSYPAFPPGSGAASALHFCHRYHTTTELGGDFFDVFALSDTEAGVFICDVMGHGVRAALVTAIVRGLVEEVHSLTLEPGKFLTEINRSLCAILKQTLTPLFASAFYMVLDVGRGEARYANAGHPAPFHVRRDTAGTVETFPHARNSPALGIIENSVYTNSRKPVASGDLLVFFTDGIYEVEGADGVYYDMNLLHAAVQRRIRQPCGELFDGLLAEIRRFASGGEFQDDVCLVGAEITRCGSNSSAAAAS